MSDPALVNFPQAGTVEPVPLRLLERWLAEAGAAGVKEPTAVAFVTVSAGGRPSARTVLLKRIEDDALIFTSALWTRKASEIKTNPNVALLFYWPAIQRQVHLTGSAALAQRELAVELFAQRERSHQIQTLLSRQGEPIQEIAPLRARHAHLMETMERPPDCPRDWGAIRVAPETVEFWSQSPDRMHDRLLYTRKDDHWLITRLAP